MDSAKKGKTENSTELSDYPIISDERGNVMDKNT